MELRAASILRHLSYFDETIHTVEQAGAVPLMVRLLSSTCKQTQRCATIILCHLSMVSDTPDGGRVSYWREVLEAGAAPLLAVLLQDESAGFEDVATPAANTLRELTEAALHPEEDDVVSIDLILNALQRPVPMCFPRLRTELQKAANRSNEARAALVGKMHANPEQTRLRAVQEILFEHKDDDSMPRRKWAHLWLRLMNALVGRND